MEYFHFVSERRDPSPLITSRRHAAERHRRTAVRPSSLDDGRVETGADARAAAAARRRAARVHQRVLRARRARARAKKKAAGRVRVDAVDAHRSRVPARRARAATGDGPPRRPRGSRCARDTIDATRVGASRVRARARDALARASDADAQICPFARPRVAPVRNPFIATLPFSTTHTPAVDRSSSRSPPHPRPGHITRADIAAACLALNLPGHDAAYVDELVAQFGGDASSGFVAVDSFRAAARRSERSYRAAWDDIATKAGAVTPGGVASPSPSPPSHPPRTMTSAEALTAVRAVGVDTATAEDAEAMIRLLTRGGDDGSSKAACVSISYQNFRRYAALLPRTQLRSKNASWCWLVSATPMKAHERPRAQPRLQLLAGGFAGACAKTLVAPLDRARTIIQDTGWCGQRGSRKTVMGVCAKVFRGEGVAGLFRGNAVSVMKVLPCNALQFAIFNGLKEQLTRAKKQQNNNTNNASSKGVTSTAGDKYSLTLAERLASGGVAGAVSTAACYPLDALKSQVRSIHWFPYDRVGVVDADP